MKLGLELPLVGSARRAKAHRFAIWHVEGIKGMSGSANSRRFFGVTSAGIVCVWTA